MTCHLQQKTGAGMSSATCCYWDKENDGADPRTTPPRKAVRPRPALSERPQPQITGVPGPHGSTHRDAGHFSVNFDNTGFDEKVGTDAIEASVTVYFVAL